MSPAHHSGQRRWLVVGLVAAVLIGLGVAARTPGAAGPGGPPLTPGALVSPAGAESTAWYCTGPSTASTAVAVGSLVLTNTTGRPVTGTVSSMTDSGEGLQTSVVVPARRAVVPNIPPASSGSWVAQGVTLSGGGVAASLTVHGPSGWSEAPCQSSTAAHWYFPTGVTSLSDGLFISLFNPTSTPDVVDLTFVTPAGVDHPINFQGLVLEPGQVQVENVGAFVQDQAAVASVVAARTGRVVASEVEEFTASPAGLALVPGLPQVERRWSIPQSAEAAGGSSETDIFNPGPRTETVTVRTRLGSGPLAPLRQRVLPDSTWVLSTSGQTRIPKDDAYSTEIVARGGPGVVVGRLVSAPTSAHVPQSGLANAIDVRSAAWPSHRWVLPGPGTVGLPAVLGAAPAHLGLANDSRATVGYVVAVLTGGGQRTVAAGKLPPGTAITLSGVVLARAGLNPLLVQAGGPLAVSEDVGPAGIVGVVTMPGIPISTAS
jgi:Family of unknown function (DUF5719)